MLTELPTHRDQSHNTEHYSFFQLHRSQAKKPIDNKHRLSLLVSYAPDWILTIVVAGLFFLLNNVSGFKREFSLEDTSIQHSYAVQERVPDSHLFLIALVAPLVIMATVNAMSIRSFWDLHTSWLGVILALALAGSVTNIIKVTVGRPRPDCIDRCQPQPGVSDHPVFGLVNSTICTQTDRAILEDGFRSFPSGHSSLSFAGLGFLSFYLAGKLHLFDQRGYTAKAWISIVPLIGAALVAVSRTMDYRHHWHDVLVGSLLGLVLAWFSYRQYYPPLFHPHSHRPFSPRISNLRPPLPHLDNPEQRYDQTERLPLNPEVPLSGYHEDMELRGAATGSTKSSPRAGTSPDLRDVWKLGKGGSLAPPVGGFSQPADERV